MESFFTIVSQRDGLHIDVVQVLPEGKPKAIFQMAHGMSEHKERFLPMMRFLAEHGYLCVMNDHRGHGKSLFADGGLGYFGRDGGKALVDDLHQITLELRKQHPGLPLFLYGHSMGSLAVRAYRNHYGQDIDGLIVCGSPGYNPARKAGRMLLSAMSLLHGEKYVSRTARNLVSGGFDLRFAEEGPDAWLTTDKEEVRKFQEDPLCGFAFTLNGYQSLLDLMGMAYAAPPAQNPDMPVHFISGEDDPCMPNKKGFEYAIHRIRKTGATHVTWKIYPGMRHEIHNEQDRQLVYQDILDKLDLWMLHQTQDA